MLNTLLLRRSLAGLVSAAMVVMPPAAMAQTGQTARARVGQLPAGVQRPTAEVLLSIGQGELITLPRTVANVWISNPGVADVYMNNSRQIHLYGKEFGEATLFATAADGSVIYSTNVRVSQNITSVDRMLRAAMPDADITVTTVGQIAVLNGTVKSPQDSEQAQRLVTGLLNPGVNTNAADAMLKIGVINRLRMATPLQVNLQVRFAEVSRSFVKDVGVNLTSQDATSGFQFGVSSGRSPGTIGGPGAPTTFTKGTAHTTLGMAGKLLGLDLLGAIDLGERIGQVTTLANPNLTALSGETGTFLAGGEIPILVNQGLGAVSVEYKQYGVSLAYTPTVMSDGRISLRVKPEVSALSSAGAVSYGGNQIPALTTRRAETTIELGSGESMMIGGLLQNTHNNSIDKAPGLGDVPILGALFRSNSFQRSETELVIVITPYLVKPVNGNDIVLPTDGYKAPTDMQRILGGQISGSTPADRPKPSMMLPSSEPSVGALAPSPLAPRAPAPQRTEKALPQQPQSKSKQNSKKSGSGGASAAPGFGF